MEEQPWESLWNLNTEMDMDYLLEKCQDDEIHGDYMVQQPSSIAETTTVSAAIKSPEKMLFSSSSRKCIISFDNNTTVPIIPALSNSKPPAVTMSKSKPPIPRLYQKKNTSKNPNLKPKLGEKKIRSESQIIDHSLAERKRRLDLKNKFIELSSSIPHLKKKDKNSIVIGTINYVEQLQKRVKELEEEQGNKRSKEPMMILNKANLDDELLPNVKAKVLEKDIIIYINCEKENGIELKILDMLENFHLFVTSTSVMPFGNSTLGITIVAKMGEAYKMTTMHLMDNIRKLLLDGTNLQP